MGPARWELQTRNRRTCHTEYHHLWADIQVVITKLRALMGTQPIARENDEET